MNIKYLLIILLIASQSIFASEKQIDPKEVQKNLRCLVCQGQSISDSNSDFAQTIKMVVDDLINEGLTEEEIRPNFKILMGIISMNKWVPFPIKQFITERIYDFNCCD